MNVKEFKLSNRLSACAQEITPKVKIADIGTDHAYIPVWLALKGKISHALACDIRNGPLQNAKKNIEHFNLNEIIETRLSDGLKNISETEADEIIIAGMGGNMIANILEMCSWENKCQKKFIFQPMKYENKLRKYLASNGYEIKSEKAVICSGKIYSVMVVIFTGTPYEISDLQEYTGKITENIDKACEAYIRKQIKNVENLLKGAEAEKNLNEKIKYEALSNQLREILKTRM